MEMLKSFSLALTWYLIGPKLQTPINIQKIYMLPNSHKSDMRSYLLEDKVNTMFEISKYLEVIMCRNLIREFLCITFDDSTLPMHKVSEPNSC